MKVKILTFAAAGLPIITTPLGAYGYDHLSSLIIEERLDRYPAILKQLMANPKKLLALGRRNRQNVRRWYDWKNIAGTLGKEYVRLLRQPLTKIRTSPLADRPAPKPLWLLENRIKPNPNPIYYRIRRGKISMVNMVK